VESREKIIKLKARASLGLVNASFQCKEAIYEFFTLT